MARKAKVWTREEMVEWVTNHPGSQMVPTVKAIARKFKISEDEATSIREEGWNQALAKKREERKKNHRLDTEFRLHYDDTRKAYVCTIDHKVYGALNLEHPEVKKVIDAIREFKALVLSEVERKDAEV